MQCASGARGCGSQLGIINRPHNRRPEVRFWLGSVGVARTAGNGYEDSLWVRIRVEVSKCRHEPIRPALERDDYRVRDAILGLELDLLWEKGSLGEALGVVAQRQEKLCEDVPERLHDGSSKSSKIKWQCKCRGSTP